VGISFPVCHSERNNVERRIWLWTIIPTVMSFRGGRSPTWESHFRPVILSGAKNLVISIVLSTPTRFFVSLRMTCRRVLSRTDSSLRGASFRMTIQGNNRLQRDSHGWTYCLSWNDVRVVLSHTDSAHTFGMTHNGRDSHVGLRPPHNDMSGDFVVL